MSLASLFQLKQNVFLDSGEDACNNITTKLKLVLCVVFWMELIDPSHYIMLCNNRVHPIIIQSVQQEVEYCSQYVAESRRKLVEEFDKWYTSSFIGDTTDRNSAEVNITVLDFGVLIFAY